MQDKQPYSLHRSSAKLLTQDTRHLARLADGKICCYLQKILQSYYKTLDFLPLVAYKMLLRHSEQRKKVEELFNLAWYNDGKFLI